MGNEIEKLQKIIDESRNIVFFGGAGVSTESGIPDFRSQDGLYNQKYDYPPETILSHTFFMRKPEEFFKFYRDKMLCDTAKPNAAHLKLAEMEQTGKLKAVITQNIDNLHQMAGSKKVLELHGSVYRNHCVKCGKFYDFKYMKESEGVPRCSCGGMIKPDVVLYEEGLDDYTIQESVRVISEAEVLIIGGTSLAVYPAAGLIDYFRGNHLVVINKAPTPRDKYADLLIKEPIGQVFSDKSLKIWEPGRICKNKNEEYQMGLNYEVGDIVTLKKAHPCGSKEWEILRVGADFRLKCKGCGHQIMVARRLVEKNTRDLKKFEKK